MVYSFAISGEDLFYDSKRKGLGGPYLTNIFVVKSSLALAPKRGREST